MKPFEILRRITKPLSDEQVERQLIQAHGALGRGNASEDILASDRTKQAPVPDVDPQRSRTKE